MGGAKLGRMSATCYEVYGDWVREVSEECLITEGE